MSSQQLWSSLRKKPRWPNPEESIGQLYGEKQGRLCWRAQGPAHEAFCQVAPAIKEYLNNCSEAVPGGDWVTWSIYMIGRSKSTAVPTIMFECFQKGPRKEAMDIVRKSGILNQYPGMETGHWSFPPNIVFPQQLALMSMQDDSTSADSDRALGPQITVQTSADYSGEHRKATVGGFLRAKGKNYYFTVNHPFSSEHQVVPWPSSLADFEDECEFGGESDAEDDDEDVALVDVTSRGSRTPESSSYCNSDDEAANSGSLESSGSEDVNIVSPKFRGKASSTDHDFVSNGTLIENLPAEGSSSVDTGDERISPEEKPRPAIVSPQDLYIRSSFLDYALICSAHEDTLFSVPDGVSVPFSEERIPFISLASVANEIPENASVLTMTGSSGVVRGTLSGSPAYTRLPGAGAYQEVFVVKLNGPLHPGDCGSCVFNAQTGSLYGHIVAGSTATQTAYILPAAAVFKDIFLQLQVLDQTASSLKTYPSYCFRFGQLAKHFPQVDSQPAPPTRPFMSPKSDNNTMTYDSKAKAATQDITTSIPTVLGRPRGRPRITPPTHPFMSSKSDNNTNTNTNTNTNDSKAKATTQHTITPTPMVLQCPPQKSPTSAPDSTVPMRYNESRRENKGKQESQVLATTNTWSASDQDVTPTYARFRKNKLGKWVKSTPAPIVVKSSQTSPSEISRRVGFAKDPLESASRPMTAKESWAAYDFETHAQKCVYCRDPYEVHRNHEQLCEVGHRLAQEFVALACDTDGEIRPPYDEERKLPRLELPSDYVQVKGLLKAVDRSIRHRSRTPFVSMDRTYYTPARVPVRSRSTKLSPTTEQPSQARTRPRSGDIVDWPSNPPSVGRSTAGLLSPTITIETNSRGRSFKRGSLYEQDLATQRRDAKQYAVEVREPSVRDVRERHFSGYYR